MRRVLSTVTAAAVAFLFVVGCRPELGERDSIVTHVVVLAVRGEPPEARPGAPVRYDVLVASPDGRVAAPAAAWATCRSPKLLTENGAVSPACLSTGAVTFAEGSAVEAPVPLDACALFGPVVTSAEQRPRDPDATSGYYQPIRVTVSERAETAVAFGLERIGCGLANAPADVAFDHARLYVPNTNPSLDPLGASAPLDSVPAGSRLVLRASWPSGSAEHYVAYDLASGTLQEHREALRVSWFATAGAFESDRTGRSEAEEETFSENGWTAPDGARQVHLFVVLRDVRGGVTFVTQTVTVR